jgi:hypothetical protein
MPDRAAFTPEEYAAMESLLKGGQRAYDLLIESYVNKYFDPALATSPEERARLEAFQQQRGDKHLRDMTPDQLSAASPRGWQEMQTYNRMRDPFFFPQLSIGSHFVAAYERMPGGKEKLLTRRRRSGALKILKPALSITSNKNFLTLTATEL